MNNKFKLVYIFKYVTNTDTFELSKIEVAKHDTIIIGEDAGKDYINKYNSVSSSKNKIVVDVDSLNNGFYLDYTFDMNNIAETIQKVTDYTYFVKLLYFKYLNLDDKNGKITLKNSRIYVSKEEERQIKDEYLETISELVLKTFLYIENCKLSDSLTAVYTNKDKGYDIRNIINHIKNNVIAQDDAINEIVPAILLNQRLIAINNEDLLKTQKNNILVEGPTGVGKTLILEELAKIIDVPIVIKNITNYSTVGYVGEDLKQILVDLINNANGNIKKAETGIICLDEIDKLGDTSLEIRKGVQQELLSWMNKSSISIKYKENKIDFDTSKITFVGLGAFEKLRERDKNQKSIGFDVKEKNSFVKHDTEDYIWFGMQRELMGRFNNLVPLKSLEIEDLKNVLLYSKISPLKNFIELANIYGVEVLYDDNFIEKIATNAFEYKIGARGLMREINKLKSQYLIRMMANEITLIDLTDESKLKRMLIN